MPAGRPEPDLPGRGGVSVGRPDAIGLGSRGQGLGLAGAERLVSRRPVATSAGIPDCRAQGGLSNKMSAEAVLRGDAQYDGQYQGVLFRKARTVGPTSAGRQVVCPRDL